MPTPVSSVGQTQNDYSNEKSSWSAWIVTLTAANLAATQTLITNLYNAVNAITLGNPTKTHTTLTQQSVGGGTPPANVEAQREKKWLVRYTGDANFKTFTLELPCADLSFLSSAPQSDFMDQTDPVYTAFKTAFEAVARSPDDDTETVTVQSLQFVGRRG